MAFSFDKVQVFGKGQCVHFKLKLKKESKALPDQNKMSRSVLAGKGKIEF